jgi:hypothetical protein
VPEAQACGGGSVVGPAASSTFATADFTSAVNMPGGGGQVVVPRELFGVAAAAPCDNTFFVMTQSAFQSVSRSLSIPLVRLNCNSGLAAVWSSTYNNGGTPNYSQWQPFIDNIGKCVDLSTTKVVIGVGFPDTGGLSNTAFANLAAGVVSHLRTTSPTGGGAPINPLYWEYLNEVVSISSSGFNAFVDAVNGVAPGYTCMGPTAANDFGQLDTLINGIGARSFLPDEHAYLFCPGDPVPSDAQMAQAIKIAGTNPQDMAGAINGHCDGHISSSVPFFWGEWNLQCGPNVAQGQTMVGALFGASNMFKCVALTNRPLWGGIWEWSNNPSTGGDGDYGIILNNASVSPVGYFLSKATQKMPGRMVTTSLGGGAPNMAGWSTVGSSGNFGVYLHNWDGVAHSGPVALSHWPVNTTGIGTATVWTQSGSTPAGGSVTTTSVGSVTPGVTGTITVPSFGQVIISVP